MQINANSKIIPININYLPAPGVGNFNLGANELVTMSLDI